MTTQTGKAAKEIMRRMAKTRRVDYGGDSAAHDSAAHDGAAHDGTAHDSDDANDLRR